MVSAKNEHAIETYSLTKIFGDFWGRSKVLAVDSLDLKIRRNEVYGLLGPNGSGKTTTLKMLLGLLYPTKGKALMLGRPVGDSAVKANIGYLPEDSYLYKFLNAREILDFYGRIFGIESKIRTSRIEALLDMVGLAKMANRPIGTYSKGMARRIGLAQALINDPQLLILDEPTSGMDPIGTRQMKNLIVQLAKRGKTILLCSHLLADVEDVCDRIGILYGGKMQVEGEVSQLLEHRNEKQILTGQISDDAISRIRQIVEQEQSSFDVKIPMDRLENYFINIVTSAQQKNAPTSGAMSTTKIGEFLTESEKTESILDSLVKQKVDEPPMQTQIGDDSTETIETDAVEPVQAEEQEDRELLDKLSKTQPKTEAEVEATQEIDKPAPEEVQPEKPVEPDRDLLDKLTGKDLTGDSTTERPHPEQNKEGGDA